MQSSHTFGRDVCRLGDRLRWRDIVQAIVDIRESEMLKNMETEQKNKTKNDQKLDRKRNPVTEIVSAFRWKDSIQIGM